MKKALSIALAMCLALSVSACSKSDSGTASSSSAGQSAVSSQQQAQRVEPLPSTGIDTEHLADGTYAVSFSSADVIDDGGLLELHFTVYDYDRYDAAQIAQLAAGDTLVVDGQDMTVETVEQTEYGIVVNGGLENDGTELAKGEGDTYHVSLMDDAKDYQALGCLWTRTLSSPTIPIPPIPNRPCWQATCSVWRMMSRASSPTIPPLL